VTVTSKSLGNEIVWNQEAQEWHAADCNIEEWRCKACQKIPVQLKLPDNIDQHRENRIISIDACIVNDIQILWKEGIQTLSCCCGHKENAPSIVIDSKYNNKEIDNIINILGGTESDHEWELWAWHVVGDRKCCKGKCEDEQILELIGKAWNKGKGGSK